MAGLGLYNIMQCCLNVRESSSTLFCFYGGEGMKVFVENAIIMKM